MEQQLDRLPRLTPQQRRFLSVPLMENGWHLLVETVGPPARPAAFAIGRTGVYALVFTDSVPDRAQVRGIRESAEKSLRGLVLDRGQFVPHMLDVMLLMANAVKVEAHDSFLAVDESTFRDTLVNGDGRFSRQRASELAAAADARLTRFEWFSSDDAPTAEAPVVEELFAAADLQEGERDKALGRPFQDWMTFLDPEQLSLVTVNFNGPARFSGPAGTGKTVVALHRMAQLAKQHPGRMLFTSFVKTLPAYHQSGFARLAPHAAERTEFIGLHAWTARFLAHRGVPFHLVKEASEDAFARAWVKARDVLGRVDGTDHQYWQDELHRVIKGRGITTFKDENGRRGYRSIKRTGREGVPLFNAQREAVWNLLFEPYRARLEHRGVDDFNDLIRKAVDELRARPLDDFENYAMVVVDEVQDCTLLELQLVHQIAGGESNAQLLLVGDGQQQVYAGGWTLSDAGIPIVGRGRVLRTNYRNRETVLNYAQRIEAANTVDDLDGGPGFVLRDSEAVLSGGRAVEKSVHRNAIETELIAAITESGFSNSEIAVITHTPQEARNYQKALERAGFPVLPLADYDGTQPGVIKVGSVRRGKGMDFGAVFHITESIDVPLSELTGGERDRAEILARQTLVALTRARDYIWVAYLHD
ncbi:UvrD-helicase domain-containing protein [Nocardia sp. NPDC052001]|uniref:UvrD-helicase domain-containing protein n=1 Tax=Nocardia sp. NPDC052001 TaxID=3154853 RepID=UPI00342743B5